MTRWRAWVVSGIIFLALCLAGAEPVEGSGAVDPWLKPYAEPRPLTAIEMSDAVRAAGWPEHLTPAVLRVAWCESSWRWWATSRGVDPIWGRYHYIGLMQVEAHLHAHRASDLSDPVQNLAAARSIYAEVGWRAWPYCRMRV